MSATSRDWNRTVRAVRSILLIGVVVTVISIGTTRDTGAEEPGRITEPQAAGAAIQPLQPPLLLSVAVVPDAEAGSAEAMLQNADGAPVAPIAVDLGTMKPDHAP